MKPGFIERVCVAVLQSINRSRREVDSLRYEVEILRRRNAKQQKIIENSHSNNKKLREEITRLARARGLTP